MTNPFAIRGSANSWVMPVSAMSALLGFAFSLSWLTKDTRESRIGSLPIDQRTRLLSGTLDIQEEYARNLEEVRKLRKDNTNLQNAMASESGRTKILNESLQEAKMIAGLTEVEGPGIVATLKDLRDSKTDVPTPDTIIHDKDVLRLVNELWASGAEAVAIEDMRVGANTSIRCVGPVIHVDGKKIASPIQIRAIGDAKNMAGGLNLPGGILDELRQTGPGMVQIEEVKKMRLPAYAGSTGRQFAKVPKDKK